MKEVFLMVYCMCDKCGVSFPKISKGVQKCLYCGSVITKEKKIDEKDLSIVDRVIDKMLLEKIERGEIEIPD